MSHQPTKSLTKTSKWLPKGQAKHERCLPKGHAGIQVFWGVGGGGGREVAYEKAGSILLLYIT